MANALGDPVSLVGPQPDAFTIRQSSADSDYAVAVRVGEATDFAGYHSGECSIGSAITERVGENSGSRPC
jgi:hypothetical protein